MHSFEWHKCFTESQKEVEDAEHPGCHSTSKTKENVEKVSGSVRKN
jgi:hypothetical protein